VSAASVDAEDSQAGCQPASRVDNLPDGF
jgi:hypothetical protein